MIISKGYVLLCKASISGVHKSKLNNKVELQSMDGASRQSLTRGSNITYHILRSSCIISKYCNYQFLRLSWSRYRIGARAILNHTHKKECWPFGQHVLWVSNGNWCVKIQCLQRKKEKWVANLVSLATWCTSHIKTNSPKGIKAWAITWLLKIKNKSLWSYKLVR
jgi:hypothetical protein